MKDFDLNTSLIFITFALSVAIFLSVLFGCSYKNRTEMFENPDGKTIVEVKEVLPKLSAKPEEKPAVVPKKNTELTPMEEKIKKGIETGSISEDFIIELIKKKEITKNNIENIIKNVSTEVQKI